MGLLENIYGTKPPKEEKEPEPEIIINKRYRLCVNDNPDEEKYRCGKRNALSPACSIAITVDGLTFTETKEIERDIRSVLEDHGFVLR
jgi:hypothetical protein